MLRLRNADLYAVLDFVGEASLVEGDNPFPRPVLERFARLLPCDCVSWVYDGPAGLCTEVPVLDGGPGIDVYFEVRDSYPLCPPDGEMQDVIKASDFYTRRELMALPAYVEYMLPWGARHVIAVNLDAGRSFNFQRADGRDFGERDRAVLELLRPHLIRLCEIAELRARSCQNGRAHLGLTAREHEILEYVATGKTNLEIAATLWISESTVRKHLENAFVKLEVRTRTAAVARLRGQNGNGSFVSLN